MPPSIEIERTLWSDGYRLLAGVDEVGRGCLAGPVVAAAVIMPEDASIDGLDDSKKLKQEAREALAAEIRARAIAVSVGVCSPEEIDRLNILWASLEAMRRAVFGLRPKPDFLLIDGDRAYPDCRLPHRTIVKGDALCRCIAAASIVAKTERDAMMRKLHDEHPHYNWITNVGYPTAAHFEALEAVGPSPYHRRSFRLTRSADA